MITSNKAIIMSKLFLFNSDNQLIQENLKIVDSFTDQEIEFVILAKNVSIGKMKSQIPEKYEKKIVFIDRSTSTKEAIIELKQKGTLIAVIGFVDEDAIFAFNCRLPLFNPEKLLSLGSNTSEKVKKYGLPITRFQNVIDCFRAFDIHEGNYFEMHIDDQYSVISLNNANTHYQPVEEARIKEIFEANLKGNEFSRDQRILLILLFHLINEVTSNSYYQDVDYWGTFPSSKPDNTETSISFLKEAVRVIVNGGPRTGPEILIRHTAMKSKHTSGLSRLQQKCNTDFDTLEINDSLVNRIKGKVICIIDDYITNGYSAESAKHLLLSAGAKKVIFLSIGKFGSKYFLTNYDLDETNHKFIGEELFQGNSKGNYYDKYNDNEILNFTDLV
ncbi:phosphoribosyltransferase [Listeria monocytogenes]|nr:phosphoribosyltransferase [Listeria monocytogenes]